MYDTYSQIYPITDIGVDDIISDTTIDTPIQSTEPTLQPIDYTEQISLITEQNKLYQDEVLSNLHTYNVLISVVILVLSCMFVNSFLKRFKL